MRIGIDARMYGPNVGGGGLGRYVEQLIHHLQTIDTTNRYIVFLKKENFEDCQLSHPNMEKRLVDVSWYGLKEQLLLPRLIDQEHCDLVHFPHWNVPLMLKTPFVVTIHDLILLEEPLSARVSTKSFWLYLLKYQVFRITLYRALRRARAIITISDYSKRAIQQAFPGVTDDRLRLIYNGVTKLPASKRAHTPPCPGPYLLYVGNAYPHKNLDVLIQAFSQFAQEHPSMHLVLVAKRDVFYTRLIASLATCAHNDRVHVMYETTDAELAALYQNAFAYIAPARVEGFGLPGLEAMQQGTPVIAARASCFPEIYQDAALYFDPSRPDDLAHTLTQLVDNPHLQKTLVEKGYARASSFDWKQTALATHAVYVATPPSHT